MRGGHISTRSKGQGQHFLVSQSRADLRGATGFNWLIVFFRLARFANNRSVKFLLVRYHRAKNERCPEAGICIMKARRDARARSDSVTALSAFLAAMFALSLSLSWLAAQL